MKTIIKILTPVICFSLMASTCTQCRCSIVIDKQSLAAGWCTLTIETCEGNTNEIQVDEIVYESYNIGDCYP